MREGILNIDMEVVNKHNLNLNHIVLLEYLIDHTDNIKGVSVTSLTAILNDLPVVFRDRKTLTNHIDYLIKEGIIVEHNYSLLKKEADEGKEVVEILRLFEVKAPFMEGMKKILNAQEWV